MNSYQRIFWHQTQTLYSSTLHKWDHSNHDTSPELDIKRIKIYQSMIAAAQWDVSLGRMYVATDIPTLSIFYSALWLGHLDLIKQIHGHLETNRRAKLHFFVHWLDILLFQLLIMIAPGQSLDSWFGICSRGLLCELVWHSWYQWVDRCGIY